MKLLFLLWFSFLTAWFAQPIFASTGDTQTLQQWQEEINALKKQENILQFKWSTFQLWNESIGDIMKVGLDSSQRIELESIITSYIESRDEEEKNLAKSVSAWRDVSGIKTILLEWKHQFYKDLIPYIEIRKLESFKNYIDSDLNYNEKSKNIQTQIEQKDIEQNERIEELYDDRDDHARDLRKQIEAAIKLQVQWKLDQFVAKQDFAKLNADVKIEVFTKIIQKFETAIDTLEDNASPTRALEERIIGLEIVVEILQSYIDTWK